jgi:hypothetical protein
MNTAWWWWTTLWTQLSNALKLPYAGYRNNNDGVMSFQNSSGFYWSSSPVSSLGYNLLLNSSGIALSEINYCVAGFSVRCFKN